MFTALGSASEKWMVYWYGAFSPSASSTWVMSTMGEGVTSVV
jgi:hypothetical protein